MEDRTPRFSGALGQAPLFVPLAILIAVPVLAMVYAYVDVYSPIAGWVSILFVLGFGFSLGWTVGKVGYLARCRSPGFLKAMGAVAGLVGLYCSWAWFEYALLHKSDDTIELGILDVVSTPAAMWELGQSIAESGWYSIRDATPSGAVLWAFWAIEAVLVVGMAVKLADSGIGEHVFCEDCERWCEADGRPKTLALPAAEALDKVKAGDLEALASLAPTTPDPHDHLLLDLRRCSRCKESGAFRLRRAVITLDKKGKPQKSIAQVRDYERREPAELEKLSTLMRT